MRSSPSTPSTSNGPATAASLPAPEGVSPDLALAGGEPRADAQAEAGATAPVLLPRGCTSLKLRQLSRRVSQHYDQLMATVGLKTTQYSLLSHIARLGPVRPGDLADAMEMDASTLTRNLQPLQAQGWVRVGPGHDGRSRQVVLTEAGQRKRSEAQRQWKQAQLALNDRLGLAQVAALHGLIDDCMARMHAPVGVDVDDSSAS